ncbi:MAG: hypothetical protein PUD49_01975, partial [Collinsella sp.]|nr:hypothetical protein [Collinsella sp.]
MPCGHQWRNRAPQTKAGNQYRHMPKTRTIDLLSWRQHSLSKGLAGMTTQQQIDIEFDSLA